MTVGRLTVTVGVACSAPDSSHCEEQSDVAIYFSGGARRQMGCFTFKMKGGRFLYTLYIV